MELKNLTNFSTDYLDAYCNAEFGHTNWEFVEPDEPRNDINCVVVFWKESKKDSIDAIENSDYFRKENDV